VGRKEIIPLSVAAEIAGRSVQTLKRWIREGRLTDRRRPGDRKSRIVVSRRDLESCLTQLPRAKKRRDALEVLQDRFNVLERVIDDLRSDKERLLEEKQRLAAALEVSNQERQRLTRELWKQTDGRS